MFQKRFNVEECSERAREIENCETREGINPLLGREQKDDGCSQQKETGHGEKSEAKSPNQDFGQSCVFLPPFDGEEFTTILYGTQAGFSNLSKQGEKTRKMIVVLCHFGPSLGRLTPVQKHAEEQADSECRAERLVRIFAHEFVRRLGAGDRALFQTPPGFFGDLDCGCQSFASCDAFLA